MELVTILLTTSQWYSIPLHCWVQRGMPVFALFVLTGLNGKLTRVIGFDSLSVAVDVMLLFFNVVSVIASILCFFVLWLSFTSNIYENSWEFGVLRAIGLSAGQVIRVYIYEALAIIMSALVLGSGTGLIVAATLTLQFNLFTEMAFRFDFPYVLFTSVVAMSLSVAVGGSYLASLDIKSQPIAQTLKGS